MKPRDIFLAKLRRGAAPRPGIGSATSIVTSDLMDKVGAWFPQANTEAEAMARLAGAGYTELGLDNVMPLFGVWHESAAIGCEVGWGDREHMPDCRHALLAEVKELLSIPRDFLKHPACAVPLQALRLLKQRIGADIAVVGKVFGPWTLGLHVYGIENFLMETLDEPDNVKKAMRRLMDVTVAFAQAQIDAGADALCVGDHCTRDLCSPETYRDFLRDLHQELHERISCPIMLHICGDTSDRIPFIRSTGMECFHFDSKVPAARARELAGERLALMGGTSNLTVVLSGTPEALTRDVEEKLAHRMDILGPECAVPLNAPYKNLRYFADEAKRICASKDLPAV